jgi:hypothetical protein
LFYRLRVRRLEEEQMRARTSGRGGLIGVTVVVLAVVLGALGLGGALLAVRIGELFETTTVDRSPPPVLQTLRDLSQYKAASASFEVIVDTERDVKYLPSFIAGERTLFVAVGSVDATVDFSALADSAVVMADDRGAVSIRLPRAVLAEPVVDTEQSRVAARSRGLFDRVAGIFQSEPTSDRPLYLAAEAKMADAAKATSLRERAEENTRIMLTSLLRSLGFERVTVTFVETAPVSRP